MPDQAKQSELLSLTTNIVAAHVSNNSVAATDLPMIIRAVYDTLSNVGSPRASEPERPSPAVPLKQSVPPEFILRLAHCQKPKLLNPHRHTPYYMEPRAHYHTGCTKAKQPMAC